MGCSKLNSDLCNNLRVIPSDLCLCGLGTEDALHFFLTCPRYAYQRIHLFNAVSQITDVTLSNLLFGNPESNSFEQNKVIFDAVHDFMKSTSRFND